MPEIRDRATDIIDEWHTLAPRERIDTFRTLDRIMAEELFIELPAREQGALLLAMPSAERRLWLRLLRPDDTADVIQQLKPAQRPDFLTLLDDTARREVVALLAYAEDAAGGLMSPRFARLRPEMTVGEAIAYLQRQARAELETIYYAYVLGRDQCLVGVASFRDLFNAPGERALADVMRTKVISVPETMDDEEVARVMARHDLSAVPVVDGEGRMQGIVTVDDIVDVVQEAATEDMHRLGGMEVLDTPYLETGIGAMLKKRAGWLSALFLGEMLTASAMAHYEDEIAKAVVLALFVPLVISSGGNSGSQATTLIVRAMALGELHFRNWWRVMRREFTAGLALGSILAAIGVLRIVIWEGLFQTYGEHYIAVAATVAAALLGVVTWGTIAGSMLPFIIRRLGFDPASASVPFVATLVDVSGLVIYFTAARVILEGTLL